MHDFNKQHKRSIEVMGVRLIQAQICPSVELRRGAQTVEGKGHLTVIGYTAYKKNTNLVLQNFYKCNKIYSNTNNEANNPVQKTLYIFIVGIVTLREKVKHRIRIIAGHWISLKSVWNKSEKNPYVPYVGQPL